MVRSSDDFGVSGVFDSKPDLYRGAGNKRLNSMIILKVVFSRYLADFDNSGRV